MVKKSALQMDCDIVIAGAGMSGCLLAYAILKLSPSLKVVLVDDNPEKLSQGTHPGFDARSIALNVGSCELLDELGLWAELQKKAQAIEDIHISDRGCLGMLDLQRNNINQTFGYVVELQHVGLVIGKHLAQCKQLTRLYHSRFITIEKQAKQVVCQLESGQRLTAKLCVAADGANSLTRDLLAIPSQTADYGCTAIIANVRCSKPHMNKAYERFTESGPIALLPLTDDRYSLVWSVANADVARLTHLTEQQFLSELQQAFGYRAGIFRFVGKRDAYPLKLIKTDKPVTHRGLCVGNAAHCLHPVMGQGFNLGLRDLYVLAQVVSQTENRGLVGDYQMLNQYWLARQADHTKSLQMTDLVVRIFSNSSWPFVAGRNIALQAMSCFPSLALPIVKQAKGQFRLFTREYEI